MRPIKTVYLVLEEHGVLDLLRDNLLTVATKEIYSDGRPRWEVQRDIKAKERAIEALSAKYERRELSQERVRQVCVSSCYPIPLRS